MKEIIIRADDLGYSEGVNYGIVKSVKEGIVRSVGIMTNMPKAEHGVNLLKGTNVCLGLHANISAGAPLMNPIKVSSIVDEQGNFKTSKVYRNAKSEFVVLEEVVEEIEAQYQRFVELVGNKPDYLEGHAVQNLNFYKALQIIADRHQVDYLGLSFSDAIKFCNQWVYFVIEAGLPNYNPFKTLKKMIAQMEYRIGTPMLVLHPGYLDAYIMKNSSLILPRIWEVEMACSEETKRWLKENDVQVISYKDLKMK